MKSILSIACDSACKTAFAVGIGSFWRTIDSGATWTVPSNIVTAGEQYEDVAMSADGSKGVAVSRKYIYTTADSGLTWKIAPQMLTMQTFWRAVTSSSDGKVLA